MPEMPGVHPPCADCGGPASHHKRNDDGTFGPSLIDQSDCHGYRDGTTPAFGGEAPPNRHVLPGAESLGHDPGHLTETPDADLAEVLVDYGEIFQQVHQRYFQEHAQLFQENAELRAGFNQAVARMKAAEAERDALKQILAGD